MSKYLSFLQSLQLNYAQLDYKSPGIGVDVLESNIFNFEIENLNSDLLVILDLIVQENTSVTLRFPPFIWKWQVLVDSDPRWQHGQCL